MKNIVTQIFKRYFLVLFIMFGQTTICLSQGIQFDKVQFLKECGYILSDHLLAPEQEKNLILTGDPNYIDGDDYELPYRDSTETRLLNQFLATHDYAVAMSICRKHSTGYVYEDARTGQIPTSVDHFFAWTINESNSTEDIIELILGLSKWFKNDDALIAIKNILQYEDLLRDEIKVDLYPRLLELDDDPGQCYNYSKKWLNVSEHMYAYNDIGLQAPMREMAYYDIFSEIPNTESTDNFFKWLQNTGHSYTFPSHVGNDPLIERFRLSIEYDEMSYAKEILNYLSIWINEFEERSYMPTSSDIERYLTLLYINIGFRDITNDDSYEEWFTHGKTQLLKLLSPSGKVYKLTDYISPYFKVDENILDYIPFYFNSPSNKDKYDLALYTKGYSLNVSSHILQYLAECKESELVNYCDSIRINYNPNPYNIKTTGDVIDLFLDPKVQTEMEKSRLYNERLSRLLDKTNSDDLWENFFVSCDDLIASIPTGCSAIELIKLDEDYVNEIIGALILNHGDTSPRFVKLCNYEQAVQACNARKIYNANNTLIYSLIFKPIEEYITGSTIYFASTDILSLVNMGAIADDNGVRLMDKYNFIDCISTRAICDTQNEKQADEIVLYGGMYFSDTDEEIALADIERSEFGYLRGSLKEVNEISTLSKKKHIKATVFTGYDATEEKFKAMTGTTIPIIHIATHGFYYNETSGTHLNFTKDSWTGDPGNDPLNRCGIGFAGGKKTWMEGIKSINDNDGILLGGEIARMNLNGTDLLVLSACNTGLGEINNEGISGLQRAFKSAGVKNMVLTLKPVDDNATYLFMSSFYKQLLKGTDKHTAFKNAIDRLRNDKKYSDPAIWASYIMLQ